MKFPLSKLLEKRGINSVKELTQEEKATFDRYKIILSGETVSVDKIKEFCKTQIQLIEERISSQATNLSSPYLAPCLHVYLNILRAIEAPEKERELLEQHLTQLINE